MMNINAIQRIAYRLLTPNETFDVRLFDYGGRMHADIRRQLLKNTIYIINRTVKGIKGLKVHDIFLTGSSSGYFYHEKSDIDIRIEVHNENCPWISNETGDFNAFLNMLYKSSLNDFKFRINRRFVDVKLNCNTFELMSLYSVLYDKWIITPDRNITAGLDINDIMDEFDRRYTKACEFLQNLKTSNVLKTLEEQQLLSEYYHSFFDNNNSSIREYIIYKLLTHSGILFQIKQLLSDTRKEYYSIIEKKEEAF